MNLAQNSRKFLTALRTTSFSSKVLFNGITKDGVSRLLVKTRFRILYCGTNIATLRLPSFYSDATTFTNNETNSMVTEDMGSSVFRNTCTALHKCTAV